MAKQKRPEIPTILKKYRYIRPIVVNNTEIEPVVCELLGSSIFQGVEGIGEEKPLSQLAGSILIHHLDASKRRVRRLKMEALKKEEEARQQKEKEEGIVVPVEELAERRRILNDKLKAVSKDRDIVIPPGQHVHSLFLDLDSAIDSQQAAASGYPRIEDPRMAAHDVVLSDISAMLSRAHPQNQTLVAGFIRVLAARNVEDSARLRTLYMVEARELQERLAGLGASYTAFAPALVQAVRVCTEKRKAETQAIRGKLKERVYVLSEYREACRRLFRSAKRVIWNALTDADLWKWLAGTDEDKRLAQNARRHIHGLERLEFHFVDSMLPRPYRWIAGHLKRDLPGIVRAVKEKRASDVLAGLDIAHRSFVQWEVSNERALEVISIIGRARSFQPFQISPEIVLSVQVFLGESIAILGAPEMEAGMKNPMGPRGIPYLKEAKALLDDPAQVETILTDKEAWGRVHHLMKKGFKRY
ncbi:hypothetical protein HYV73_01910 [Candidatus Uhrbacteria bacterium]|nr:hypothetical protein [Candidatus Uhrbacteria bacterium]